MYCYCYVNVRWIKEEIEAFCKVLLLKTNKNQKLKSTRIHGANKMV